MEFTIDKPTIKQGYSYVLKSSWLQEAVIARQLRTSVHLVYWTPTREQTEWTLIRGAYWLPNQRVSYPRFYIEVGGVPVPLKPHAETMVRTAVIPPLLDWMIQQEGLDRQSTRFKKDFLATLKEGTLMIR